jgi:hypothetical protein
MSTVIDASIDGFANVVSPDLWALSAHVAGILGNGTKQVVNTIPR